MPIQFTHTTVASAATALSARLYDRGMQQWSQVELQGYLVESLRTFNAISGFWRSEMSFPLEANTYWYDLRTIPSSIVPYTVTQFDLIKQIEYHLLEPANPTAWTGSDQFNLSDILTALQRRQDDTLGTTGCTITRSIPSANIGTRTTLPDNVIDIRRVAWLPAAGFGYVPKILRQSDRWASRAFAPNYTTLTGVPSTWLQSAEPPISFDVDHVPPVTGVYDVLSVNSGGAWTAGVDAKLSVPDDWSWVVKWGALGDLLSRESNARDIYRAEYCRRRYAEGMALLSSMPTALALRINNIPRALSPVRQGDDFNARWQAKAPAAPRSAYVAGNLLGLPLSDSPLTWASALLNWSSATFNWNAGGTIYGVTVNVVQNIPVVSNYMQVARDDLDAVIDYAQHLAMFKSGGTEFSDTVPLYQRFQKKAAQYNSKLREMGFFSMDQLGLSSSEEAARPRYSLGDGPADSV